MSWRCRRPYVTFVWSHVGFPMIFYLAGLQAISKEWYEAATIDGANAFQRFRHVTMPGPGRAPAAVRYAAHLPAASRGGGPTPPGSPAAAYGAPVRCGPGAPRFSDAHFPDFQ